ncbi:MAG: pilus assembly PilX N-terminal domain-containing protein [Psychrobacillus psychrodurans]
MRNSNEQGYALFLTILVLSLVSILGISLITITSNANKITVSERSDQSLYYIAETGINLEKSKILQTIEQIYNKLQLDINDPDENKQKKIIKEHGSINNYYFSLIKNNYCKKYNDIIGDAAQTKCNSTNNRYTNSYLLEQQFSEQPISDTVVDFSCESTECTFTISAVGKFENSKHSRELKQKLEVKSPNYTEGSEESGGSGGTGSTQLSDYNTITKGNINLSGSSTVNGSAASLNGTISLDGGARVNGNVSVSDPSKFVYPSWMGEFSGKLKAPITLDIDSLLPAYPTNEALRLSQLKLPDNIEVAKDQWNKTNIINDGNFLANNYITNNYVYSLQKDMRFKKFEVDDNNTLTLNIGSNTVNLYVNDFNIKQGHIKIQGTGKLNIYVKNSITIKGSFNNQPNANLKQLNIFYEGTTGPTFSNETKLYGSYFSKTADITLTGGAGFYGNIYSGGRNITISGGVPTEGQYIVAPKAKLNLLEGGSIKGSVIVDNIIGSGGTSINNGKPIVPLPTLPSYIPIRIEDSSSFIKELAIKEI